MAKELKVKQNEERYANELVSIFREIAGDRALLKDFLQDLLSPAEYKELGVRWQIIKQLSQGRSHRDVAKNLHVAIATVTRGSRELLDREGGFQKTLQKISNR